MLLCIMSKNCVPGLPLALLFSSAAEQLRCNVCEGGRKQQALPKLLIFILYGNTSRQMLSV